MVYFLICRLLACVQSEQINVLISDNIIDFVIWKSTIQGTLLKKLSSGVTGSDTWLYVEAARQKLSFELYTLHLLLFKLVERKILLYTVNYKNVIFLLFLTITLVSLYRFL